MRNGDELSGVPLMLLINANAAVDGAAAGSASTEAAEVVEGMQLHELSASGHWKRPWTIIDMRQHEGGGGSHALDAHDARR